MVEKCLVDRDWCATSLDKSFVCSSSAADWGFLAGVVNVTVDSNDVDGGLLARDTDHTSKVVESDEGASLLGPVTEVLEKKESKAEVSQKDSMLVLYQGEHSQWWHSIGGYQRNIVLVVRR